MQTSSRPEVDDWRPAADFATLRLRAQLLGRIRGYFSRERVLEVDTPALSRAATTDPAIASFRTSFTGPGAGCGRPLYLHTSPEMPMKRLLAAGSGSIYQVCKVFRDAEQGILHNPEFTLLEWYRVGYDHFALMDDVERLLGFALEGVIELPAAERWSYGDAFQRAVGLDPHEADSRQLRDCAEDHGVRLSDASTLDHNGWLELLFSHLVESVLPPFVFMFDYPASQAALARLRPGDPALAERFEVYLGGLELANGFNELTDVHEQRRRFEAERRLRRVRGLPEVPCDERFLSALTSGLPACAGVALGVDRLLLAASGAQSLAQVMTFPANRA